MGYYYIVVVDVNECTINNGGCEANCMDTEGSYVCSCEEGFELNINQHNCDGESQRLYSQVNCAITELTNK